MEQAIYRQTTDATASRDYFHHLHDTLILLGASPRFAELVEFPDTIKPSDVDDLRRLNCELIESTKDRLVNINKLAVSVAE